MSQGGVIEVKGLTKRFAGLAAVDDVSLALREGEFFALLGPSGCGKTTLLRLIAGFEAPDEGAILLSGEDITRLRANRRPINLMFQSYALFPHMTVHGNVAYGLEMERLPRPEIERRVGEILELAELTALARRKPPQLSGGQRQRVALARALVKRPRVLLLDEPLAALDKKLRTQMQLELKRLQHELGITFLVVTHDQEEALVMSDRIALMNGGRIAQLDTPRRLYEHPTSCFAAGFIGMTNLFEGTAADGGIVVDGLGLLRIEGTAAPAGACALSVRPERIEIADRAPSDACNGLRGTIADLAYQGQDINLLVAVPGRVAPITARVPAADERTAGFAPGQTVWCTWRPDCGRLLTE